MQYAKNKKAYFDYEILETLEAGLVLTGNETKSIRTGHANMKGSFVAFHKDEAYLTNMHISKYKYSGSLPNYVPDRSRKLLLKAKEISYLRWKSQEKGLTIVPLSLYTKGRRIKVEIGVARGKKKYDKRESLKRRDLDREARRAAREDI